MYLVLILYRPKAIKIKTIGVKSSIAIPAKKPKAPVPTSKPDKKLLIILVRKYDRMTIGMINKFLMIFSDHSSFKY